MINIEGLNPEKIILFGSYAYGTVILDNLCIDSRHLCEIVV
jgi:hypothetical protein